MAIAGALDEFKMVSYSSFPASGAYISSSSSSSFSSSPSSSCCCWAPVVGVPGAKRVTVECLQLIRCLMDGYVEPVENGPLFGAER